MSESALKAIEKEFPKLQAELVKMKEAAPKSEALVNLIGHIANTPEPFYSNVGAAGGGPAGNPWLKPAAKPMCVIQ
jgi:hypothetical protein